MQDLSREQVTAGIAAGLQLTAPESEIAVPMKLCAGVLVLREILLGLGQGALAIVPTNQMPGQPDAEPPKDRDPAKQPSKNRRKKK